MERFNFFKTVDVVGALEKARGKTAIINAANEYLGFLHNSKNNFHSHDGVAETIQKNVLISALALEGIVLTDSSQENLSQFVQQLTSVPEDIEMAA